MLDSFKPFSLMHAIVIVAFAVCCTLSVKVARRASDARRRRAERIFAILSVLLFFVINHENWLHTQSFDAKRTLPLHACDLSLLIVPIVLALPTFRAARAVLYYFAIALSTQGFFTPDLREGPAHWPFWSFWLLHFAVVGTAIYDVGARGFRPGWKDLRVGITAGLIYVAIMLALDVTFGWNYGYVGPSKPEQPSLIDYLGPWPGRVAIIVGIGIAVMILITLPFKFLKPQMNTDKHR